MTSICKSVGVPLLKRKDHIASEHYELYDKLKEQFIDLKIDRLKLQIMVFNYKKYKLQEMFGSSKFLLNKILDEWHIKTPPRDYWRYSRQKRDELKRQLDI